MAPEMARHLHDCVPFRRFEQGKAAVFRETIDKLAEGGPLKVKWFRDNPLGFFFSAMMAGVYVGFGILLIFSLGSGLEPAVRPLVMGASFGLALILVVFAGSELYTGYTMSLTVSTLEGTTTAGQLATLWSVCWIGNLLGALLLGGLFVAGGGGLVTSAASKFIYVAAAGKMSAGAIPLLCRAILCNWLVCLALWIAARVANEAARMIAIAWCLFAFVASGYEHSIANMTIFAVALFSPHPATVTWAGAVYNLFWVTLGNTIAGAVLVAGAYWTASKPASLPAAVSAPAE